MSQRIFQLESEWLEFPDPQLASSSPNGLLAIGGDLSVPRLKNAYFNGIFPWYGENEPLLWWSPDPRAILSPGELSVSKSLAKLIRKKSFQITLNSNFEDVITNCAFAKRISDTNQATGTWIDSNMMAAYCQLHNDGHAHSVEVWQDQQLVGGLYGVSVGKVFCGESMFHRQNNASKVAFYALNKHLVQHQFAMIDCQIQNPHLQSLGVTEVPRSEFLATLKQYRNAGVAISCWEPQSITYG